MCRPAQRRRRTVTRWTAGRVFVQFLGRRDREGEGRWIEGRGRKERVKQKVMKGKGNCKIIGRKGARE